MCGLWPLAAQCVLQTKSNACFSFLICNPTSDTPYKSQIPLKPTLRQCWGFGAKARRVWSLRACTVGSKEGSQTLKHALCVLVERNSTEFQIKTSRHIHYLLIQRERVEFNMIQTELILKIYLCFKNNPGWLQFNPSTNKESHSMCICFASWNRILGLL